MTTALTLAGGFVDFTTLLMIFAGWFVVCVLFVLLWAGYITRAKRLSYTFDAAERGPERTSVQTPPQLGVALNGDELEADRTRRDLRIGRAMAAAERSAERRRIR